MKRAKYKVRYDPTADDWDIFVWRGWLRGGWRWVSHHTQREYAVRRIEDMANNQIHNALYFDKDGRRLHDTVAHEEREGV